MIGKEEEWKIVERMRERMIRKMKEGGMREREDEEG